MSEWNFDDLNGEQDDVFGDLNREEDWYGAFGDLENDEWNVYSPPSSSHAAPRSQQQPQPSTIAAAAPASDQQRHIAVHDSTLQQPNSAPDREPETLFGFSPSDFDTPLTDTDLDSETNMPPRRRLPPQDEPAVRRRRSVVDLTLDRTPHESSTSGRSQRRKRSNDDAGEGPAPKQGRFVPEDIEEIDLANEAPSAEEELLQAQQQEAIRSQQAADANAGPQSIGKRQCIICMENYTNCTTTPCGHFYCHECLIQALRAGAKNSERGTGTCPVCRRVLSAKKKGDVIPILFMKKKTFEQRARARAKA